MQLALQLANISISPVEPCKALFSGVFFVFSFFYIFPLVLPFQCPNDVKPNPVVWPEMECKGISNSCLPRSCTGVADLKACEEVPSSRRRPMLPIEFNRTKCTIEQALTKSSSDFT